ncbi:acetoacetate decarboxylase [Leptospira gomenensis]|uniref:Acetoacetate decarboxylase n=1 Tax=Leptospira gomenensis TaxID=2484974 RepID=A0A5F1YAF4_9LEPT|nr:acetoacetate decarboxylase [Leptospira gomenensis]TGK33406.1 acetoacetate decarboxylase [Leptospira gomenensis]TGK40927.1 acetoacetate decarboxylase [Leptospira gomenensis]TGK46402.1 acetoacetate decarboxylase [Leptospira gomenensis]TGK67462.1 acetoacetate decarboxylase [Leptospira gomenensis]
MVAKKAKKTVKKKSVGTPKSKSASHSSRAAKSGSPKKTSSVTSSASKKSPPSSSQTGKGRQFPAPWNLYGEGFVFPLWAKKDYNREMGFFSEEDSKQYKGGLGSLMLVNYEKSDVGPYYELLYIPGNFEYKGDSFKRITRIFVSSQTSVEEGIRNWAIPKEKADFIWIKEGNLTKISAFRGGKEFFRVSILTKGFSFPVSTKLLPYTLLQKSPEGYLKTRFIGKGKGRIATIQEIWSDEAVFPDAIKGGMFQTGVHSVPFELVFPKAIPSD